MQILRGAWPIASTHEENIMLIVIIILFLKASKTLRPEGNVPSSPHDPSSNTCLFCLFVQMWVELSPHQTVSV